MLPLNSFSILHSAFKKLLFSRSLRCSVCLILGIVFGFSAFEVQAQTLPDPGAADQSGIQPYGSYHGGEIDSVGLTNGTLTFHLPFLSYPQRGALHASFSLLYNTQLQHWGQLCVQPDPCEFDWGYLPSADPYPALGSAYIAWDQQMAVLETTSTTIANPGKVNQITTFFGNYSLQMVDGSKHVLGNQGTSSFATQPCCGPYWLFQTSTGPFETLDATGWRVLGSQTASQNTTSDNPATPTAIIGPDGVQYTAGTIKDPNGNEITYTNSGITDSLGRQIPWPASNGTTNSTGCTGPLPISYATLWTPPGYNGGTQTYKFCYAWFSMNMGMSTSFKTIPIYNGFPGGWYVLQSIVLPNGQAWEFEYADADSTQTYNNQPVTYGTLTKVTLPTGGSITYTYETLGGGLHCNNGGRWIASRTVNDDSGSHTWLYNYQLGGSGGYTVVTDPLGNDTVHTFGIGSVLNCSQVETQTQVYAGSYTAGTVLKTTSTTYMSGASANSKYGFVNLVPTQVTTTWPSGQVTKVTKAYDSGFSFINFRGGSDGINGLYGKQVSESTFDYGPGAAGSLLRTTNTSYAWQSPNPHYSNYVSNNLLNLVASAQICSALQTGETADCGTLKQRAKTTYAYDGSSLQSSGLGSAQQKTTGEAYPGNQTSVQRWLNTGTFTCPGGGSGGSNGAVVSNTVYFDTGMVSSGSDPCNHATSYLYSGAYVGAFPTTITNALGQQTVNAYDLNAGVRTSTTDPNQLLTTYTYDSMARLQQTVHPDSASDIDTITRQELTFPVTATLTSPINTGQSSVPLTVFDGLGRVSQTQHTSDPQGTVYVDKTYDGMGRLASVSNPYRRGTDATSSPGTTSYTYDALGRKTLETLPDNSAITTAYCGPWTLVTDPTGKWRRSRVDALGRMVEVDEPNSLTASVNSNGCPGTNDPVWVTSYTYDALGNLTQIVQNGSHQRTFTYDSLSRLLTSVNPENSTSTNPVAYTYNPDGTVLTKTDARGIKATYSWDALHRATGVAYSNGDPSLTFTYDEASCLSLTACQNIGHRTSMTDGAGSEHWAYQVDKTKSRNIHREQRTTTSSPNNITKTTTYYLDFKGNVTQIIYPTGRTVNYTYDSANRPSSASDASSGITYVADMKTPPASTACAAGAVCYTPQGSVYAMSLGQSSSFTGFDSVETFNTRLQPSEIKASSTAGTAIDITYSFVDPVTGKNAGHVYAITNNLNSGRSQAFTYDQLNRLTSAGTTATTGSVCWGYQYSYDAWGNLLSQAAGSTYGACTQTNMGAVTADANNHITGFSYDASGNTLGDGIYSYTWDDESQMKTAAGVTYSYDGDGKRVSKSSGKMYWYGSGGEILAETNTAGGTSAEYIFFGGKRIAMLPASGNAVYYAEDTLGSARVIVQSNGTLCYDGDFTPFGAERAYTNTCGQNYKFEGKERDLETQNDDFGARYYSYRFGRWLSSDWSSVPVPVPYANLSNPQTLNLYAMVADDPESFADLDGHEADEGSMAASAPSSDGSSTSTTSPASTPAQQATTQTTQTQTPQNSTPTPNANNQQSPTDAGTRKLDPNSQECKDLAKKIDNTATDIQKRMGEIKTNPLGLPETALPGSAQRDSVEGHQEKVREMINDLGAQLDLWNDKCGGGPPPSPVGVVVPAPSGAPSSVSTKTIVTGVLGVAAVGGAILLAPETGGLSLAPLAAF